MGERAVSDASVIDETFAGLASPSEVHSMGRLDIETGRPGELLVAEVQKFEADGGFKQIAKARADERRKDESGNGIEKKHLPDFGIKVPAGEARDLDIAPGNDDENS